MTEGTLTLSCTTTALKDVMFDAVPNVSEQISASITRVPIVTFRADQAFAFDTGTTSDLSFTIIRTQKRDADDDTTDSRFWTNAKFEEMLVNYIDRWQAETDGCTLKFEPLTAGQSIIRENVYLSNLTIRYDKGVTETLYINLNANIGTMTAQIKPTIPPAVISGYTDPIYEDESLIMMSSSDASQYYDIFYGAQAQWNSVSSYNVICGPEQPFPVLTLNISKKNLSAMAPKLVDDIIAGKNKVFVYGIGSGEYIVTKVSSSGQNYKVVAYSIFEQYRASPINKKIQIGNWDNDMPVYATPIDVISTILYDQTNYGTKNNKIFFNDSSICYCFRNANNTWDSEQHYFEESTDAWYVLNVAAAKLGCKIWFADNKVYVVDTSISDYNGVSRNVSFRDYSDAIYVNMDLYEPETATEEQINFTMSVCGETELGDEGADVLKNYTVVGCNDNNDTVYISYDSSSALVKASRVKFGVRKNQLSIPELSTADATDIATNMNERYCDSEQSIGFKLSEMHYGDTSQGERAGKYWQPYFPQLARVNEIYDYSKDLAISNKPNFSDSGVSRLMNKLTLSTAQYFYPEGYTEYWFGIISPADFAQNTSVINNIVYNG